MFIGTMFDVFIKSSFLILLLKITLCLFFGKQHIVLKPLTIIVDVSISPSCVLKLCCYIYKESNSNSNINSWSKTSNNDLAMT